MGLFFSSSRSCCLVRLHTPYSTMTENLLHLRGTLKAHGDWVTSIATTPESPDMIISGSRDKSIIQWRLTKDDPTSYGVPQRSLTGHSHFVSDVVLSSDGQFALSCSWDRSLRLWELETGNTTRTFNSHTGDVLSVAFSADNRQIVSGSRDKTLKLWNTLGECKHTIENDGAHNDWVSCVRFSPNTNNPLVVSGGWDKLVKVWNLRDCKLRTDLVGHTGYVSAVTVAPDGSLCASGGNDGTAMLWDLSEGKWLYSLPEIGNTINALTFSPEEFWLCAATDSSIMIWDLQDKTLVTELNKNHPEFYAGQSVNEKTPDPACISLAWSADGHTLYAGYTDNVIRVWHVR